MVGSVRSDRQTQQTIKITTINPTTEEKTKSNLTISYRS